MSAPLGALRPADVSASRRGSLRDLALRVRRDPITPWIGALVGGVLLVVGVLPLVVTTSPIALGEHPALQGPGRDLWLGTDQLGRDVAARVLHGARLSLLVAASTGVFVFVLGGVLGGLAAIGPRWAREVVLRVIDVWIAFPGILLAIVLAASFRPSLVTTIVVLGVTITPSMARVVRAAVFDQLGEDYVTAARWLGASRFRLLTHHLARNAASPILVTTTQVMAYAILGEAGLSFLGAGVPPPTPSLGNMIYDGQTIVYTGSWWIWLFPGLAIVAIVLFLNRFADALGRRLRSE